LQPANLGLARGMTPDRLGDRRGLLHTFDATRRELDEPGGSPAGMDAFTAQALEMMSTNRIRDAFDVTRQPDSGRPVPLLDDTRPIRELV
jgi:hypothetical protein